MYKQNSGNHSFHGVEPPPDPEDYQMKEEEEKNKELLNHLKEQQRKHRYFVEKLEREKFIQENAEREQILNELIAQKAYYERRNKSAKYRAAQNNERIRKMLNKVDDYMKKISKVTPIDKIKEQAQKELMEEIKKTKTHKITKEEIEKLSKLNKKNENLRNENKQKIEERKRNESKKKEKIKAANLANQKAQEILKNGYKDPNFLENLGKQPKAMVDKNKKSPNNTFKFEDKTKFGGGDHCAPNDNLYKTKTPTINPNIYKMYNNYQDRYENPEEKAEHELRSILKKDPIF